MRRGRKDVSGSGAASTAMAPLHTDSGTAGGAGAGSSTSGGAAGAGSGGHYSSNMFGLRAEGYELKGDGKKRKFKPLEAMRKFFGKGKRKAKDEQVSVVTIKAKSTTALHHHPYRDDDDDDEDDDDGGFKNRQPRPLGGNRSLSEDSVFSPEIREHNRQALKKAAVSEESLPKSAFQAELFSKLSKRRSQYSDEDDGLPHSPTPPVTTADIIMGGPLKPLPAAGKSTSRESDKSLISNDASENEEDDPFKSQWKSSVPSKVSKNPGTSGGSEVPIDFEKMGHTELLKSDIAKDRISVKPRSRKTNRQSRKKREGQSPHSLPSLNEESPPKSRADTASTSSMSESQVDSARKQETSIVSSKPPGSPVDKAASSTPRHQQLTKQLSESSPSAHRPASTPVSPGPLKPFAVSEQEKREIMKDLKSSTLKEDEKRVSLKQDLSTLKEDEKRASLKQDLSTLKDDEKRASLKQDLKSPSLKEDEKRASLKSELRPSTFSYDSVAKASFDSGRPETEPIAKTLSTSKTMDSVKSVSESSVLFEASRDHSSVMSKSQQFLSSSSKSSGNSEASSSSAKPKLEFLSSSVRSAGSQGSSSPHHSTVHANSESQTASHTAHSSTAVKTPPTADNTSSPSTPSKTSFTSAASPGESKREGLRQTDSQTSPAFSPKDDYKLRRQSRSKTLPDQPTGKEEPFATKVQRAASHRVEATSSQDASPESSPRHKDKVVETSKSKEPEWFALARKKTGRQDSEEKKDSPSPTKEIAPAKEPVPASEVPVSSAPGPKAEAVSHSVETSGNMSVSSASSKFERFGENKLSEVSRVRGGSVKTSPTKTHVFANRGSSVKVQSGRADSGITGSSVTASSPLKTTTPVSSASASSTAASAKQEAIKEESKGSESSPSREVPKWKTQSVKTSAFSSSTPSVVSSSKFSSVKISSQSTPTPLTSTSATKTETRPTSSPAKKSPLTKTPPEEKEKASVPAWRANLSQKKPPASDIKIELIESSSSSSGTKKEDSAKKEEVTIREESPTKASAASKDVPSDPCRSSATPSRASKVMNLLKNFENVQGVS